MTPPTTKFSLVNNTGSSNAFAYVNGLDLNDNNAPIFIQADGKTVYKPASPSKEGEPLGADCAISLGAPGSKTEVTVPHIAGGRIWFVVDDKLSFLINPGPAVAEPAVTNPADENYNKKWGFAEFTYNQQQLFVNISYVDFVSLPIALNLTNTDGKEQIVKGLPDGGLAQVCDKLAQQESADGAGWGKLVVKGPDGGFLRALSPNAGRVLNEGLFDGYYQKFVDDVWAKYQNEDLKVNTQWDWGEVTGRSDGSTLTFDNGDAGTFSKPSAADIFSCSTGPFANYPEGKAEVMGAVGARLAASLNRSTLLDNAAQPDGEKVSAYYSGSPTNHYARICHEVNIDGRGYAFPYDDVVASNETEPDQAGTVFDGAPQLLTVSIGKLTGGGQSAGDGEKDSKKSGGMMDRVLDAGKSMMKPVGKFFGGVKKTMTGCFK